MNPKTSPQDPCCGDDDACSSGSRNRYYIGKRLTPASFGAEQDYQLQRRRLINRAVHGWGVVYGFATAPADAACGDGGALQIGPGLALDAAGRELVIAQARLLRFADVRVLASTATQPMLSFVLRTRASMSSRSPGTTGRRNFALSIPARYGTLRAMSPGSRIVVPPSCASASIM